MKVLLVFWLIFTLARAGEEDVSEVYTKNNPLDQKDSRVFRKDFQQIIELYSTDREIRNLQIPPPQHLSYFMHPDAKNHPPIFFNLYKNGQNEGVYMLKNQTATKIMDGTDSATDYALETSRINQQIGKNEDLIFISASDGIYTYNLKTDEVSKFGNVTDNFKAIDKVPDKDEIYVLAADDKIYRVTEQGTVKTKVEGINYAKDFIVDLLGAIYFIGENNKPEVLYKESTSPVKVTGLNFDIKKSFLSGQTMSVFYTPGPEHIAYFLVEGVLYVLMNTTAIAVRDGEVVNGLTSFNAKYSYVNIYGANGVLYMQFFSTRSKHSRVL